MTCSWTKQVLILYMASCTFKEKKTIFRGNVQVCSSRPRPLPAAPLPASWLLVGTILRATFGLSRSPRQEVKLKQLSYLGQICFFLFTGGFILICMRRFFVVNGRKRRSPSFARLLAGETKMFTCIPPRCVCQSLLPANA